MTFGDVMRGLLIAFYADFAVVAVFFLSLGILLGCWIGSAWQERRRESRASGLGSWDTSGWLADSGTVFEPGVAKVGDR